MIAWFRHRLRRLRRREEGTATVEFVILFPVFITLVISGFEAGMLMTRQLMLERGLDMTMRSVRLGKVGGTSDDVKKAICDASIIIPDCMNVVMLEMQKIDKKTWNDPLVGNRCVERGADVQPKTTFTPGGSGELMIIRACAVFDPMFPATGLGVHLPRDASGGYRLMATSAFVYEP